MINALLVDLDDTLIENKSTYYIPQLDATRVIVASLGRFSPAPTKIIAQATQWQINDIKERGCIAKECFPNSYMHTYRDLCEKASLIPNKEIMRLIIEIASKYISNYYEVLPGVVETLKAITTPKILVTKGHEEVQSWKLQLTNLSQYFDGIEIVKQKNKETYIDIISKYDLKVATTAMVGDSLKSDIMPALELGLITFHLAANEDNWDTNNVIHHDIPIPSEHAERYFPINDFKEILIHLAQNTISD